MSNYGIKISKPGVDVKAAEPADILWSSKFSNFKIHSVITKAINIAAGYHVVNDTIDNPLGYSPFFRAFVEDSNQPGWWHEAKSPSAYYYSDPAKNIDSNVSFDPVANKFKIHAITWPYSWPGGSLTFKIVIFADSVLNNLVAVAKNDEFGIKVSKEGKKISDVDSSMIMSSKYKNLTIFQSGNAETVHANGDLVAINHNLGYVPIVSCYQRIPLQTDIYHKTPSNYGWGPYASEASFAFIKVNSTQLVIKDEGVIGNDNILYKYIIFNERIV